jgi:hypothetical protein
MQSIGRVPTVPSPHLFGKPFGLSDSWLAYLLYRIRFMDRSRTYDPVVSQEAEIEIAAGSTMVPCEGNH